MLKVILRPNITVENQKIEWVDADYWVNEGGPLACYKEPLPHLKLTDPPKRIAEFAKGEWIGVKLSPSKEDALAEDLENDPRVRKIMADHLVKKLK